MDRLLDRYLDNLNNLADNRIIIWIFIIKCIIQIPYSLENKQYLKISNLGPHYGGFSQNYEDLGWHYMQKHVAYFQENTVYKRYAQVKFKKQ